MSKTPAAAKRGIPPKSDFREWYPFIVEAAELVDKRYPLKGMDVWRPYGWKTMRLIDDITHQEMERTELNQLVLWLKCLNQRALTQVSLDCFSQ